MNATVLTDLKAGDKISVLLPSNNHLAPGGVKLEDRALRATFKEYTADGRQLVWIDVYNMDGWTQTVHADAPSEGILWCRGWDEESVQAMMVAYSLTEAQL